MSQGKFVISKYQEVADANKIHKIRVQEETLALDIGGTPNTAPTEAVTEVGLMFISKGNRAYGKRPIRVRLEMIGTPPTNYAPGGTAIVALLNNAIQSAALVADESTTINYLGTTWRKVGELIDEDFK